MAFHSVEEGYFACLGEEKQKKKSVSLVPNPWGKKGDKFVYCTV